MKKLCKAANEVSAVKGQNIFLIASNKEGSWHPCCKRFKHGHVRGGAGPFLGHGQSYHIERSLGWVLSEKFAQPGQMKQIDRHKRTFIPSYSIHTWFAWSFCCREPSNLRSHLRDFGHRGTRWELCWMLWYCSRNSCLDHKAVVAVNKNSVFQQWRARALIISKRFLHGLLFWEEGFFTGDSYNEKKNRIPRFFFEKHGKNFPHK